MDPFKKRDELRAEARDLRLALERENRKMTTAEAKRLEELHKELTEVLKVTDPIEKQTEALKALTDAEGKGIESNSRIRAGIGAKMAEAIGTKALDTAGRVDVSTRDGIVALDRRESSILGLLGGDTITTSVYEYLRQTTRTLNADTVAMGGVKPTSTLDWEKMTAKAVTIAHVSNPIARQKLADLSALQPWVAAEMGYGIERKSAEFVFDGGTDENGDDAVGLMEAGLLPTSAFVGSDVLSIRRALRVLEDEGTNTTGVVLNSSDWEAIETSRYPDGKWVFGGPSLKTPRILWGLPVVIDPAMPAGAAIVGNFREAVEFMIREALALAWSEAGEHFAKNEVIFRAEARVALAIPKPPALRVVDLVDPEEA